MCVKECPLSSKSLPGPIQEKDKVMATKYRDPPDEKIVTYFVVNLFRTFTYLQSNTCKDYMMFPGHNFIIIASTL